MIIRRLALSRPTLTRVSYSVRFASSTARRHRTPVTLGIRREDPGRIWERRCPLTPDAVATLIAEEGIEVAVQACERRVFSNDQFRQAGATIKESLGGESLVIGIKEIPLAELDTSPVHGHASTHIMFSHTAKGQTYNLPLLSRFVENPLSPRLIDYEQLTGEDGKRTVGFGFFAGSAGVIEGLHASALDLLEIGIASPFLHLPRPFANRDLASVKASLRLVGTHIATHGMPPAAGPFVVAVTGSGNVARGALDMLAELPIQFISHEQLPSLLTDPNPDLTKVYVVHALQASYVWNYDGSPYSREAYYKNPSEFESLFYDTVAPYTSLLINGAGWQPGFPRLISNAQLELAIRKADAIGKARFRSVADVSCDVEGGLEFVSRSTTIDAPTYTARPAGLPSDVRGIQVMAVDILPTEVPYDSSVHFSNALLPYLRALIREEKRKHGEKELVKHKEDAAYLKGLERATIAQDGKLTKKHEWLYDSLQSLETPTLASGTPDASSTSTAVDATIKRRKKVLLLGSGMVAKPFCESVWRRSADVELVVASNNLAEAKALVRGHEADTTVVGIDIADWNAVGKLVAASDIVASLLPASLHPQIAEHCLEHRKHLVTASYISPAMRELHDRAVDSDVLFLNEIGLDPGIDHMSAMEMRDRLRREGKRIVSFTSWCGGLPAPEFSNVPLGMKFSWSPKALLSAASNDAHYKMNGDIYQIPGAELLNKPFKHVPIMPGFALEGLANRDSVPYAETYGLGPIDTLDTVFRGTLRYKGFAHLLSQMAARGLLSTKESDSFSLNHWNDLGPKVLGAGFRDLPRQLEDDLVALSILPGHPTNDLPRVLQGRHTPMDFISTLLAHKLRYLPHERDMVILSHELVTVPIDVLSAPTSDILANAHARPEVHTSTLVTYGQVGGHSAMARTVGLPLASATLRILDGEVRARGVAAPVESEIYIPVLEDLKAQGIELREEVRSGRGMASMLVNSRDH